ncbi:SDR family NAD(P)-dependent oxidoreductase [Sphingobacterium lactis]|uniref:SDR family NAD(P)-dependent oxidoreductase n=1 Tax=Sphingobacterium lactis TaxID=797291 RepID=UPI003DA5DC6B
MDLFPKYILVTGATSGIGRNLVEFLVRNPNLHVFGIGRDSSKLGDLLNCSNFTFLQFDLTQIDRINELINDSLSGVKLSGFVHCAGMEETLPISLYTPAKVQNIFSLNVFSAIEILRILSKKKFSEDGASFILLSSVMGELGQAGKVGYCSSKAALIGIVKALSLELAKRKIRVNSVSPGVVQTPLTDKLFQQLDEDGVKSIINMHPLGIGETEDVVATLAFLLSKESKWITGQNFKIDGGYSAH